MRGFCVFVQPAWKEYSAPRESRPVLCASCCVQPLQPPVPEPAVRFPRHGGVLRRVLCDRRMRGMQTDTPAGPLAVRRACSIHRLLPDPAEGNVADGSRSGPADALISGLARAEWAQRPERPAQAVRDGHSDKRGLRALPHRGRSAGSRTAHKRLLQAVMSDEMPVPVQHKRKACRTVLPERRLRQTD